MTGSPMRILTARVDDFLRSCLMDSDSSSEGDRYLKEGAVKASVMQFQGIDSLAAFSVVERAFESKETTNLLSPVCSRRALARPERILAPRVSLKKKSSTMKRIPEAIIWRRGGRWADGQFTSRKEERETRRFTHVNPFDPSPPNSLGDEPTVDWGGDSSWRKETTEKERSKEDREERT